MNVDKIAQVCSEPLNGFLRARVCPQELCVRISHWGTCVGSVCSLSQALLTQLLPLTSEPFLLSVESVLSRSLIAALQPVHF